MQTFLVLHIVGAVAAAALVVASVVAIALRRTASYRPLARAVAVLGVAQILSGALLSWASSATLLSFCVRVGAYLAVLTAVEVALVVAIRRREAALVA